MKKNEKISDWGHDRERKNFWGTNNPNYQEAKNEQRKIICDIKRH